MALKTKSNLATEIKDRIAAIRNTLATNISFAQSPLDPDEKAAAEAATTGTWLVRGEACAYLELPNDMGMEPWYIGYISMYDNGSPVSVGYDLDYTNGRTKKLIDESLKNGYTS